MFEEVAPVVTWIFSETSKLVSFVWGTGWIGVILICLPLAKRVVDIFKKLF